ncbi:hypothetical protein BCR33DRAFT_788950 [Rhizoclosmatium globosum]|uniref:Uncharacterized protein n=1 Tax=Rhizoclosmatium globosum TaxID=329046 RepID=A0A1Y2BUE1_9FUNG|nr:hypothetical protein BCR33DRAFT_788950 [Rhizoclosmatium globosum]|eukprot:ORY38371.1 hypothetical protein BCR33DRAFT_788950 [Rhizoclosmatium globosum]
MNSPFDRLPNELLGLIFTFAQPPVPEFPSESLQIQLSDPEASDDPVQLSPTMLPPTTHSLPEIVLSQVCRRFRALAISVFPAFDPARWAQSLQHSTDPKTNEARWGKKQWNLYSRRYIRLYHALASDANRVTRLKTLRSRDLTFKETRFDVIDTLLQKLSRSQLEVLETISCRPNVQAHVWKWVVGRVGDDETWRVKEIGVNLMLLDEKWGLLDGFKMFLMEATKLQTICFVGPPNSIFKSLEESGFTFGVSLQKLVLKALPGDVSSPVDLTLVSRVAPGIRSLVLYEIVGQNDLSGFTGLEELTVMGGLVQQGEQPPLARKLLQSLSDDSLSQLKLLRVGMGYEREDTDFYRFNGSLALSFLRCFEKCRSLEYLEVAFGRIKVGHLALILAFCGSKLKTLRVGRIFDYGVGNSKRDENLLMEDHNYDEVVQSEGSEIGDVEEVSLATLAATLTVQRYFKDRGDRPGDFVEHQKIYQNITQQKEFWPLKRRESYDDWKLRVIRILQHHCPNLERFLCWTQLNSRWRELLLTRKDLISKN